MENVRAGTSGPIALTLRRGDIRAYKEALIQDPCAYCGGRSDVLDHVMPRRVKGPDRWDNLAASCSPCNSAKSARSLLSLLMFFVRRDEWEAIAAERQAWVRLGR